MWVNERSAEGQVDLAGITAALCERRCVSVPGAAPLYIRLFSVPLSTK